MDEFKRILATQLSAYYSKKAKMVSIEELMKDMEKTLPEVEALYMVAETWAAMKTKELEHYKDTTVGLWATDRPDLMVDDKKLLFELTYK